MSGPEKLFENRIKKYLTDNGCWVLKTFSNGVQRAGVPDLLCCVNGYFVAIEVKSEKGKPSELQLWNIQKIKESGGVAMVLYPKDWKDFVVLTQSLLRNEK